MKQCKRMLALLLAVLLLAGCMAGCSKNESSAEKVDPSNPLLDGDKEETETITAKYAYEAEYVTADIDFDWVKSAVCVDGELIVMATYLGEEKESVDPYTNETYVTQEYETGLFRVDLTTGHCEKLPNFVMPTMEIPEGWEGGFNLNDKRAGSIGPLRLLGNGTNYRYNVPENFDPETDDYWNYYEDGKTVNKVIHLDATGAEIASLDIKTADNETEDGEMYYSSVSDFCVAEDGTLILSDYYHVYIYGADGTLQATLDAGDSAGSLVKLGNGQCGLCAWVTDSTGSSSQMFRTIDLEAKAFGEDQKLPTNVWNMMSGDAEYDYYYDDSGKIFGGHLGSDQMDKIVDWMECDVNSNDLSRCVMMDDGVIVGIQSIWDNDTQTNTTEFVVLHRVDAATKQEKTVLTVACYYLDYDMKSRIVEYNKTHNDVRIVVKDYSEYATDDDYTAGILKLNTEIMADNVPDIFLCDSTLPMERYAAKGILADFYDLFANDTELSRDSFVPEVLSAVETDGKLYTLPTTFYLQSALGLEKIVGEYSTWTTNDALDALSKLPEGATVFSKYYTKSSALMDVITRSLNDYVNWQTGEVTFDSQAFVDMLNFANTFPAEYDYDDETVEEYLSNQQLLENGQQLLTSVYFSSFSDVVWNCCGFHEPVKMVGYPGGDNAHHTMAVNTAFALSATSENQDLAWQFVKDCVLQQRNSNVEDLYNFSCLQDVFDAQKEYYATEHYWLDENGEPEDWDGDGIPEKMSIGGYETTDENGEYQYQEIYCLTEEEIAMVMDLLQSTKGVFSYDEEILSIIVAETEAFFAGQKDAESTAAAIQSRVNLYVAEQS